MIALPKIVAFCRRAGHLLRCCCGSSSRTDLGARHPRACAKEKQGARLVGIDVDHVYAMSFGIGLACLGAAACFLLPAYYVNPQVGSRLRARGLHRSWCWAAWAASPARWSGGLAHRRGGVVRAASSWAKVARADRRSSSIFIAVLLFRPQGLFGRGYERATPLRSPLSPPPCSRRWRSGVDSGVWLTFLMMTLYAALLAPRLERAGRLRRAVLLRPRALLRHRRLRAGDRAVERFGLNPWVAPGAAVVGGRRRSARCVGALTFRYGLKGSYFALVTLAFAEVFRILAGVGRLHRRRASG
jgi:hypothetical protein